MAIKYHYCDYDTFEKIIRNQTIRLSDIRKSNDSYEMKVIYKQYEGIGNLSNFVNGKDDYFWRDTEKFSQYMSDKTDCFAICFSSGQEKLSQWERYAANGKGLAIGFDELKLSSFINKINDIIEVKKDFENYLRILAQKIKYRKLKKIYCVGDITKELYEDIHQYVNNCAFTKHIGFHEEKEFRIALLFSEGKRDFLGNKEFGKYVKNCNFDNPLARSYIDIIFPKELITKVYLGPMCEQQESEITEFLRENGYFCSITVSEIPYIPKQTKSEYDKNTENRKLDNI